MNKSVTQHLINRKIRAQQVRVIYEELNQIMGLHEALEMAMDRNLDLVQVSNVGPIPTCRLLNYKKYRYDEEKKKKSENTKKTTLKEIQIRPSISKNDLQVKFKQVEEFLSKGNPVRLRIKLRGREKANADQHGFFLAEFAAQFHKQAKIEKKLSPEGVPIGGLLTLKPQKSN